MLYESQGSHLPGKTLEVRMLKILSNALLMVILAVLYLAGIFPVTAQWLFFELL